MKKKTMFRLDVVCLMWIKKKPNLSFEHIFLLVEKKDCRVPKNLRKNLCAHLNQSQRPR